MYRNKLILGLLTLNLVFLIVFVLAQLASMQGRALIGTGLCFDTENLLVMGLCVLSSANVLYELIKVE